MIESKTAHRPARKKSMHWQLFSNPMYYDANKLIKAHNKQYADQGFAKSHVRLVKCGEVETMRKIIALYGQHVMARAKAGAKVITNALPINQCSARMGQRAKSGTNPHLAKLAFAGLILGQEDNVTPTYMCRFAHPGKGKGFGVRPVKNFHGTKRDFEILIHPDLIPKAIMAAFGLSFFPLQGFGAEDQIQQPAPEASKELAIPPKHQSLVHIPTQKGTIENKEIQKVESLRDESSEKAEGNDPRAVTKEEGGARGATEDAGADWKSEMRRRRKSREEIAGADDEHIARLVLDGKQIEVFARLLIESYAKKLITAMERAPYHKTAMDRGYESAIKLLMRVPTDQLSDYVDRLLMTIDVMQEWIKRSGGWVKPPESWFDPTNRKDGILGAEQRFLKPFLLRRKQFLDIKFMKDQRERDRYLDDADIVKKHPKNPYLFASFRFKQVLMKIHPTDTRLKQADLHRWADSFSRLQKRDRFKWDFIMTIAKWFLESDSPEALFWRSDAGGFGVRSASGFRKNFQAIVKAFHDYQRKQQKKKNGQTNAPPK